MPLWPTTRNTLLLRLGGPETDEAWSEFSSIYDPVIYRFARRSGLQHADAVDVTQQAMVRIMRAAEKWLAEEPPLKFRAWLKTTIKNLVINFVTRNRPHQSLETEDQDFDVPEHQSAAEVWQDEEHRAFLRMAISIVKRHNTPEAWQTFSQTVLEGKDVQQVALTLKKTVGAVYAARARIVKQLQTESRRLLEDSEK